MKCNANDHPPLAFFHLAREDWEGLLHGFLDTLEERERRVLKSPIWRRWWLRALAARGRRPTDTYQIQDPTD